MTDQISHSISIIVERLKQSEILGTLSEEALTVIAEFCTEEIYLEGDTVLEEGKPAENLFIVSDGKLALEKKIEIGRHTTARNATVSYVDTGRMAGFSALTSPYVYSTSAVCIEPTRVIVINGDKLRSFLQDHPEVGLEIMSKVAALVGNRYRNAIHTLTYFLSIVSHELRSPLAAIENYLRTMLGGFAGDITEKQERMIKRSILRVTDLRALIGDVVDLARMRPEQIQADFDWIDPGEIGAESIEDARLAAAEKDIRLNVFPPRKFEPIVGARRRLRQVFTNLLSNAIKYSPPESIVTFGARYEEEKVIFWVEDQGPGIPEEDLPHLFKDFFRGSNIEDTAGTGLGLSISHKIVEAHNGELLIENISDDSGQTSGARFTVILPRNLKTPKMWQDTWKTDSGVDNT
jgi:signal transduction histidine kinase